MLLGIPIALGSWWGLLVIAAMMPALIWRLIDEEKFLARNLPGYVERPSHTTIGSVYGGSRSCANAGQTRMGDRAI